MQAQQAPAIISFEIENDRSLKPNTCFLSYFPKFSSFFVFHAKNVKIICRPASGVFSTQTLVKIYNTTTIFDKGVEPKLSTSLIWEKIKLSVWFPFGLKNYCNKALSIGGGGEGREGRAWTLPVHKICGNNTSILSETHLVFCTFVGLKDQVFGIESSLLAFPN